MLTTDFTGSYDYEHEEAKHAAGYILEDLADGYLTSEDLPRRIEKERIHWKKYLPDTFEEFDKYFMYFIDLGLKGE